MIIHDCLQDMVKWYQAVRCLKFRIKKETRVDISFSESHPWFYVRLLISILTTL